MLACLCISSLVAAAANSQEQADPRSFGLSIPPGALTPGDQDLDQDLVATMDEQGKPTVARVHVQVGENQVIMLPNGKLVTRGPGETALSDKRFAPATRKEMADDLKAKFPGFTVKTSRHFVFVYNTSTNFATGTMRILETMLPGLRKFAETQALETHPPEMPLVAIMFQSEREFQAYGQLPRGVIAYYDILSNHVVMYEQSPLWRKHPELAMQQAISTIAHEGAHQILHNIGVQQRLSRWPMWMSEGLAEYLAPTTFGKDLRWKGAGEVNDMRMLELELYLQGRHAAAPDGQMVDHTVAAAGLTSTGYASAWALTHFLAKTRKEGFRDYLRQLSQLQPLQASGEIVPPGLIPRNTTLFKEHFGQNLAQLESDMIKHLKQLPYRDPLADLPHWVAFLEVPSDPRPQREANLFHTPEAARKWLEQTLEAAPVELRTAAKKIIREYPNRGIAERNVRMFLIQ